MHRSAWILIGSVLILACGDDDDPVAPPPPPPPPPPAAPTEYVWEATLEPTDEAGFEAMTGSATVVFIEDTEVFDAEASIAGDPGDEGTERPWHVHSGTCEEGGPIVGADGDYPRLVIDDEGSAEASVEISEALDPEADYHVNVHLSDDELETIIMCGDLALEEE